MGAFLLGPVVICSIPHRGTRAVCVGQLSGLSHYRCLAGPGQLGNICSDGSTSGKSMPRGRCERSASCHAPALRLLCSLPPASNRS